MITSYSCSFPSRGPSAYTCDNRPIYEGGSSAAGLTLTETVQALNPLGYWKMDDAGPPGASDILDYSGNGYHGTTRNAEAGDFQSAGPDATNIPYALAGPRDGKLHE